MRTEFPNKDRLYRYKLTNPSFGNCELYSAPDGWSEGGFKFSRSSEYWGMFRTYSSEILSFVKEARRFLIRIFEQEGTEGICEFIVEKYNFSIYDYEEEFRGNIDFSSKKQTRKIYEVTIIDSSFVQLLRVREDIPIKLFELTSIDGFDIPGNTNEGVNILLPAREDLYYNQAVEQYESEVLLFATPSSVDLFFDVVDTLNESVRNVIDPTNVTGTDGAFIVADIDGRVDITVADINNNYYTGGGFSGSFTWTLKLKHYNSTGILQDEIEVFTVTISSNTSARISYSESFYLLAGDYVILQSEFYGTNPDYFDYAIRQHVDNVFKTFAEQNCLGYMRFEAFTRIIQSISGKADAFRSKYLGRTDSEPQSYSADGDGSLVLKTNGRLIRQFPKENTPLAISLKELFQSVSVTDYVGLGIETIDGVEKVVCEDIDHFFDNRVIIEIDNAKNISIEIAQDFIFNSIKSGYSKLAYEKKDGILEYNNKSQWSTFIKTVKNELNIVSNIRGDNAGISFAREKNFSSFPSEDTQYDEDNFLIDLVRGTNLILNGKFDDWTGNIPDDWNVLTGGFLEKIYLGNTRCRFNSLTPDGIVNTASFTQSVAVSIGDILTVSLVYRFVSEIQIIGVAGLTIEIGGYKLKPDGSWDNTYPGTVKDFIEDSVTESQLQSFNDFSIISEPVPVSGSLTIKLSTLTDGFVIDNIIIGDSYMTARTNEGFDSISGTVNNEKSLNIRYSPARIMRNWGAMIRASLDKYDGSFIVYNKSEKNSNLVSKETGEDEVTENANIRVADLNEPRIDPEYITFEAPIDNSMIQTINDNWVADGKPKKYGIIKVKNELTDDYYYGWIVDIESGAKTESKPFKLLMVNTNKVIPIEL